MVLKIVQEINCCKLIAIISAELIIVVHQHTLWSHMVITFCLVRAWALLSRSNWNNHNYEIITVEIWARILISYTSETNVNYHTLYSAHVNNALDNVAIMYLRTGFSIHSEIIRRETSLFLYVLFHRVYWTPVSYMTTPILEKPELQYYSLGVFSKKNGVSIIIENNIFQTFLEYTSIYHVVTQNCTHKSIVLRDK